MPDDRSNYTHYLAEDHCSDDTQITTRRGPGRARTGSCQQPTAVTRGDHSFWASYQSSACQSGSRNDLLSAGRGQVFQDRSRLTVKRLCSARKGSTSLTTSKAGLPGKPCLATAVTTMES